MKQTIGLINSSVPHLGFHFNQLNENQMKNNSTRQAANIANLQNYSNKHLELKSEEFLRHLYGYEQFLRVLGYAESTVYNFPSYVRAFLYFLENKQLFKLQKVKFYHVREFTSHLSKRINGRSGKTLARNYQLNYLNALKRFSRYLLECHSIVLDCSCRISGKSTEERRWYTKQQIESLYSACGTGISGDLNKVILSIYYGLGLRRAEGIGLDIEDIQITNSLAHIRKGKNGKERYVPMSNQVQKDIRTYILKSRSLLLKRINKSGVKAFLISERGRRISGNAVYERLQKLGQRAGFSNNLSLHSLRHSIATHLMDAGMKLESISSFLGHSSMESTQIYTHLVHQK